tara:strand:+ start:4119 stop:4412 length:294 start_codon:yes stop_codon:yes gene_type:complete
VPNVRGKKFPYSKKGMADAKKAINEDDARGYRKRVAKAKRIKGETVTKGPNRRRMKPKPKPSGEPPNRTYPFGPGNARNKNYPGLFDPNYEKGKKKK